MERLQGSREISTIRVGVIQVCNGLKARFLNVEFKQVSLAVAEFSTSSSTFLRVLLGQLALTFSRQPLIIYERCGKW
jgi:hypothetical protein